MTAGPENTDAERSGNDGSDATPEPVRGASAAPPDERSAAVGEAEAGEAAATTVPMTQASSGSSAAPQTASDPAPSRSRFRAPLDATIWVALIGLLGTLITVYASHSSSGSSGGGSDKPTVAVPSGPISTELSTADSDGSVTPTTTGTDGTSSSQGSDGTGQGVDTTPPPAPAPTSMIHSHAPAPRPAPHLTSTVAPGPESVYRYKYVLHQDIAIDLSSHSDDHNATTGAWKTKTQNFEWFGKDDHGGDTFSISGGTAYVAVLPASAPETHQACKNSPKGGDPSLDGLNPGDRFCVFPEGFDFDALIEIVSNTAKPGESGGILTIDVRVWS
jgi:hypothetical protein